MMTPILTTMREWMFPVVVLTMWASGFTYTLTRLGEAHRAHAIAAEERAAPKQAAPESPFFASAR